MCHSLERTRRALVLRKPKLRNLTIGDDCGKGMQRIFWGHLRFVSKRLPCWDFIIFAMLGLLIQIEELSASLFMRFSGLSGNI